MSYPEVMYLPINSTFAPTRLLGLRRDGGGTLVGVREYDARNEAIGPELRPPPRWRKADPDDPSTWPDEGIEVLVTDSHDGAVNWRGKWLGVELRFVIQDGRSDNGDACVFHWMPWSEIGDPT